MEKQATLDVTTLAPLPCAECGGTGTTEAFAGSFVGWNAVVEPITREDRCEVCDGTGEAECQWCSSAAAVIRVDGDHVCARCAEEDPMPTKQPAFTAVPAYLDISDATSQCLGFLHSRRLRGDVAVIVLADNPENRRKLEAGGIHVQAREGERRMA